MHYCKFISNIHKTLPVFILALFSFAVSSHAQEVKKSTRIEKIDNKKYYIHTVGQGQTLYSIAKAYSIEVNDIVIENPTAIDGIKPDQELKIPFGKSVRNTYSSPKNEKGDNTGYTTHKVESGQTLYSISKQYNITIEELKTLNPETNDGLKTGQILRVPVSTKNSQTVQKENKEIIIISPKEGAKDIVKPGDKVNSRDTTFVLTKKTNYRIALFAPFHLENVENIEVDKISRDAANFPPKSETATQFYQGFLLAIDSLKKTGLSVQLFVYDADDSDSLKIHHIINSAEFATMNLIVGPLSNSCFSWVAKKALQKNIPIVSPVSQQNKILLNNECVSKLIPSINTQLEEQANFIAKNYKDENVILVVNSNAKDAHYSAAFRTAYNELLHNHMVKDSLHQVKGTEGLAKALSSSRTNVLVIPSGSLAYVTDMLRSLNTLGEKNKIILFGMQSWRNFANLDYDYLNKLQFHYVANSFTDYESEPTANFIRTFRILYSTEPSQWAFQGYDTGFYFLHALQLYGTDFNKKISQLKWTGTQSSFDLFKTDAKSGYDNRSVNMVMIQDYKLVKAK